MKTNNVVRRSTCKATAEIRRQDHYCPVLCRGVPTSTVLSTVSEDSGCPRFEEAIRFCDALGVERPGGRGKPQIFHYATLPSSNCTLWKRRSLLCHPACPGEPWEQPTCPRQVKGGVNNGKAVFAIQAQRAGTKNQPSPEGLGTKQPVERRRCGTTLFVGSFSDRNRLKTQSSSRIARGRARSTCP